METKIFCSECGSELDEGSVFCAECGVPVADDTSSAYGSVDDNLRPVILNRDARKHFTSGSNELEKHEFTLISRGLFSIDRINVTSANVDGDLNDKISRERLVSGKLPGWDPLPPDSLVVNRQKS